MLTKKGQVTIFVIVAILIVALGLAVYIFYPQIFSGQQTRAQLAEEYFLQCIQDKMTQGEKIMAMQGGYIDLPEFESGSTYMPFSNYFNFLGGNIPYWFYISGNNLQKTQKPSKEIMQQQLSDYVKNGINECDFSIFQVQGFNFKYGLDREVTTKIQNEYIETTVNWPITIDVDGKTTTISKHTTRITTKFGQLYQDAENIFNSEIDDVFLENYSLDVLRLNAPVSGFEISCVPKIWNKAQLKTEIQQGLNDNLATLKINGDYYSLLNEDRRYFVYDSGKKIQSQVNFVYLNDYPMRFEVYPSDGNVMRADPVGNQPGVSTAGFCYVPYHFVYDMAFPVLIQLSNNGEIFQFPIIVIIDKTNPRNSLNVENITVTPDICSDEYKNQEATILTFDQNNKHIGATVSYKCLDRLCNLGETSKENNYELQTKLPACYNGQLIATSAGYKDYSILVSSNEAFQANLFLDKIYPVNLDLDLNSDEKAMLSFVSNDYSQSLIYPDDGITNLSSGSYNVSVYVFKEAEINLPSQQQQECVSVPVDGIGGIFGLTRQECFDVNLPQQTITSVIIGGGIGKLDLSESELKSLKKIKFDFTKFAVPTTFDDLSNIMNVIPTKQLTITKS